MAEPLKVSFHKVCRDCGVDKDISFYYKHTGTKDKLYPVCKSCHAKATNANRDRNKEHCLQQQRERRYKAGKKSRIEWLRIKQGNALGRRITNANAKAKRVSKTKIKDELTDFVFAEASLLKDIRKEATGIDWHIDHIVPINHKYACGLHVAANFQVVPAKWNLKKNNKNMEVYFG